MLRHFVHPFKPFSTSLIALLFTCVSLVNTVSSAELTLMQNQLDDLVRYLPDDEIKTLIAGEQSIPVLISEQSGPSARGSAILLPDIGLQTAQLQAFSELRLILNDYGWITIGSVSPQNSIGVWQLSEEQANKLTSKPTSGSELVSKADSEKVQTQLKLIINTLNNEADNYPGLRLFVAQGATAGWLIESLDSGSVQMPDALVLIAPYLPEYQRNKSLAEKIANLNVPVLDIWSEQDNRWALATVQKRQQAARKYLKMHYRQRQLFGLYGHQPRENRLAKEIYAYMTYLGW